MKATKWGLLAPLAVLIGVWGTAPKPLSAAPGTPAAREDTPLTTTEFYVTIVGDKQGTFKGKAGVGRIACLAYNYEVVSPRDPATGLPTGKRQHKPLTIIKEWGASSPQLFQALVTNENLKSVKLEFYHDQADGSMHLDHTIKLTNANVSNVHHYMGTGLRDATTEKQQLEEISFTFQKIELTDNANNTTASDDWQSQ